MTVQINQETANIPSVAFTEQVADIAAPSAGYAQAYVKAGILYVRNSSGIWTPMANPMTTQDDLVVGGGSGVPARLAKGADGYYLRVDPSTHHLVWAAVAAGGMATDPLWDAAGDLAVGSGADTAARLAKGADSQILAVDPADHAVKWMTPSTGGGSTLPSVHVVVVLADVTLAIDTASFDVTNIDQTYEHLRLYAKVRTTGATTGYDPTKLAFNNDTIDGNYPVVQHYAGSVGHGLSGDARSIGYAPQNGGALANFASFESLLLLYAGNAYKNLQTRGVLYSDAGGTVVSDCMLTWKSTAAINRITFAPANDTWRAGSRFQIVGIKTASILVP